MLASYGVYVSVRSVAGIGDVTVRTPIWAVPIGDATIYGKLSENARAPRSRKPHFTNPTRIVIPGGKPLVVGRDGARDISISQATKAYATIDDHRTKHSVWLRHGILTSAIGILTISTDVSISILSVPIPDIVRFSGVVIRVLRNVWMVTTISMDVSVKDPSIPMDDPTYISRVVSV